MALPLQRRGPEGGEAPPSAINVILGVWLFISAFVWHDSHAQATNTWICGVLCVVIAIAGMGVPWARFLNTGLAVWLFVSAWALPTEHVATLWNNVLVAIALFVVSLVPSDTTSLPGGLDRLARST
jgi:hypothetical protein